MIDYQYQHNAHCVDWRMRRAMQATPLQPQLPRTDDDMEFERNWTNWQNQLYHGWRR